MADADYWMTCCNCGVRFGMPESLNAWLRADARRWFYCPNGHRQHYANEDNDIDAMRRERNRLKQDAARRDDVERALRDQRDAAQRSASAYKAAATRIKNRVKSGVCPCCNRTFQNLARHMASQHPGQDLDNIVELGQRA